MVAQLTPSRPATLRAPLLAAGLALAGLAGDLALDPAHRHVPLCPFHSATGWWCPLCGGLRAADAIAHLQWRAAWHDNALLIVLAPLVAAWWLSWLARGWSGRQRRRLPAAAVVALVAAGVAFTVARNLPAMGFLRPV